jgi:sulfur relay (sulfurtransferase) DsrF/TusC family protein
VFDRADAWAFERMAGLHANPLAGFMLHQKLAEAGLANNAFVFDAERLSALNKLAAAKGLQDSVVAVLKGVRPEALDAAIGAMPLASARSAFSYDDGNAAAPNPYANGLVAALMGMPAASEAKP